MNNTVYNTKKEKLKNQLSNLNQKQFDKTILKSIGNDKLETFSMWQDPTIEEYQKEIARLNKIIDELEKGLIYTLEYIIDIDKITIKEYNAIYKKATNIDYNFRISFDDNIKKLKELKKKVRK